MMYGQTNIKFDRELLRKFVEFG